MRRLLRYSHWTVIGLLALAAACAPVQLPSPTPTPGGDESTPEASPTPAPQTTPPAALPTGTPPASPPFDLATVVPSEVPVVGPLPSDLEARILADLETRTGAARDTFRLIRAESVVWSDGSLGCPQPGVFYTQMLVEGYWIVYQVGDQLFDYRASQGGDFRLCETPLRLEGGKLPPTAVIVVP
jgi:hypothetical protein